jgi:DNA-binding NtrC family response regulator
LKQDAKIEEKFTRQMEPSARTAPEKHQACILIVDDDPLVLDLLHEFLRDGEFSILMASSGEEALARMRGNQVDVVLVDFKMPGMDGLETIERIAGINPETVSILMTGFPTLDSSIRAIKLGASDYLLKPFRLEEVNLAVGRAVKEGELRREMHSLRRRVAELGKGVSEKRDDIKINNKVDLISSPPSNNSNSNQDNNGYKKR